jgi:sarcosine oxidase subunit alpha
VLVDENAETGGTPLTEPLVRIDAQPAWDWLATELAALKDCGVRLMTRTTAIGCSHQNMIGMVEKLTDHLPELPADTPRERMWRVRAKRVVLARGVLEKPLVFHGNDRPGVMLAGTAQTYLNRYGVLVGRRPVVLTCHDSAWYAALDLAEENGAVFEPAASGGAPGIFLNRTRTWIRPCAANALPRARASASSMHRPWARSRSWPTMRWTS